MIMRYDLYKDSGVEWIGEIPSHWDIKKNKYFTQPQKNKSEKGDEELLSVSEQFGVITRKSIREDQENLTRSESLVGYLKVKKGELVSNIMLMWKRGLGVSEHNGIVSPSYSVFSFLNSEPKYFHYLFRTDQYVSEFRRNSTGVIESRLRLYDDSFGSLKSHFPPLDEQNQIVNFLDKKTNLIDELIKKIEQMIELLNEQRNSLINEVVTQGLNPNVEKKESGVEWIGEIPSHWKISKLKYIVSENQQSLSNSTDPDLELDYIEISDVNSIGEFKKPTKYIFSESPSRCRRICRKGDVIISTVRTYLKSIGIIEEQKENLICSTGFSVLTPKSEYLSKYVFYMLRSNWFISKIISKSEGVSYPSVQSHKLLGTDVITMDKQEQQKIVEFLDEETQKIDKTIFDELKRIDLLKEYKQSLISEVVTGKKRVVG